MIPETLNVPDVVKSDRGKEVVRRIAMEQWAVYMRHSNDRVLERLGASLVIIGAVKELEPWRFIQPGPKKRKEVSILAYEARQQRLKELYERVSRIR